MIAHLFMTWLTTVSPTVEAYAQKKIPFKILLFTDSAPGHPKTLMEK